MQDGDSDDETQIRNPNPSSKLLDGVRRQGHGRSSPYGSSGSSDETGGSDSGSVPELKLSRYQNRNTHIGMENTRELTDGMEQMTFEDSVENGNIADGGMPIANYGSSREGTGYGMNGLGLSASTSNPMAASYGNSYVNLTVSQRSREGSASSNGPGAPSPLVTNGIASAARPVRPGMGRTPSHAYAPRRTPSVYPSNPVQPPNNRRTRSASNQRRINPDADYRAQKQAYEARLRRDNPDDNIVMNEESYPPSLAYSSGSGSEDESPNTASYVDNDPFEQEAQMMFGNEDLSPSAEELKIPANRERLEWHSMLANVLTGDVVKQEKKRMTGATDAQDHVGIKYDIWVGVRAKVCGRPLPTHKRLLDEQRAKAPTMIEDIISFAIKGEAETGKTARGQIQDMLKEIEKVMGLYPTTAALEKAHPRAASEDFRVACAAVISWEGITDTIETELRILQAWVGNDELDFQKPRQRTTPESNLTDDSSFIDRILKEDGLKSLQGDISHDPKAKKLRRTSMLNGIGTVMRKAKATLISNAEIFASKHLPPYVEELLTLTNFPSRLVQEIIRVRLTYASKIQDQAAQGVMIAEQMISQFQILLKLAVDVKEAYSVFSQPEPGWDLPPCVDEKFDEVVLSAFEFYFKMLDWKISAGKNSNKEAEILEQEWGPLSALGRHFDGGDVQVAEQFAYVGNDTPQRFR